VAPAGVATFGPKAGANTLKMTEKRVSFTLESTLDSVNMAEEKTEQLAAELGFSEEDCHRLAMAVREAMVNAVLHGNAYDPKKKVHVAFEQLGKTLTIVIGDEGRGLDEDELPNPLAPENLLKQSGRGIFLMRSFMDDVRIKNLHPGTEVRLIKTVGGTAADTTEEQQR
jgi:serine/threonine-protein kinase RsbW